MSAYDCYDAMAREYKHETYVCPECEAWSVET